MEEKRIPSRSFKETVMTMKPLLTIGNNGKPELKLSNGKTQPLIVVGRVMLVIDCSQSMGDSDKLQQAKSGAIGFAENATRDGHCVGVLQFSDSAKLLTFPIHEMSVIYNHINSIDIEGSTNLVSAISDASSQFGNHGLRVMVIVTDGMPDSGTERLAIAVANGAKMRGITIICIGTDDAEWDFLKQIASREDLAIYVSESAQLEEGIKASYKLLSA
jgi:Mg-chelatase subunit ChlD